MGHRDRLVRMKTVIARTSLSKSTIYRRVSDGTFPAPVKIGKRSTGWYEADLECWLAAPGRYRRAPSGEDADQSSGRGCAAHHSPPVM